MLKKLIPLFAAFLLTSTTVHARPQTTAQSFGKAADHASFSGFEIGQSESEVQKACHALGYQLKIPEISGKFKKHATDNGLVASMCVAEPGSETFKASVFSKPIHIALVSKDGMLRGIDLTYLTDTAGEIGIRDLVQHSEKVGVTELEDGVRADVYYHESEEWIGYHQRTVSNSGVKIWSVRVLHRSLHELE